MANRKISDLTALTTPATGDLLPIVDISEAAAADKNKKITFGELFASIPAGTAAATGIAFEGYPGTGIYSSGADQVAISTNGTGRLFVGSDGNLGLGATPSVFTVGKALEVGFVGNALFGATSGQLNLMQNAYYNAAFKYATTAAASYYQQLSGSHIWYNAPSGTAGNTITFTQAMTLDASGRLGLGTSSPSQKLQIAAGNVQIDGNYGFIWDNSTTGIYGSGSPSVLQFYTGNAERMRVTSTGVGIGTTEPVAALHSRKDNAGSGSTPLLIQNRSVSSNTAVGISFAPNTSDTADRSAIIYGVNSSGGSGNGTDLAFHTNPNGGSPTEKARIDSSGRLLVGTSSSVTGSTAQYSKIQSIGNSANAAGNAVVAIGRGTAAASLVSGNQIGSIYFTDNGAGEFASIDCFVDATPGASDYPGRLVFSTTADGAASPTERMRINNTGSVTMQAATSVSTGSHSFQDNGSSPNTVRLYNNTDSNNTGNRFLICDAGASILRAEIRSNGGLANFSANNANLSDRNAKKDISLAADTWNCVKEWEIVNYRYNDQLDDADLNLGVIAQQVAESCPEVITVFQEAKEATEDAPAQEERLGVKEQQMYWMAIKALQEAIARIEALEADVAALKGA